MQQANEEGKNLKAILQTYDLEACLPCPAGGLRFFDVAARPARASKSDNAHYVNTNKLKAVCFQRPQNQRRKSNKARKIVA